MPERSTSTDMEEAQNITQDSTSTDIEEAQNITQASTSTDIEEAQNITQASTSTDMKIKLMNSILYKAAAKGDINAIMKDHADALHLLRTRNKNTLLHIYITARRIDPIKKKEAQREGSESTRNFSQEAEEGRKKESKSFMEHILGICPSLLSEANANGEIPLHLAARYGFSNMVEILINHAKKDLEKGEVKILISMTNKYKDTALHEAVRFNHIEVVRSLLTKEDPHLLNSANLAGETPLYLAAERSFAKLVTAILKKCPSAAHCGPGGRTALHAAVINNNKDITKSILGAKKEAHLTTEADEQGWTPLHYAALSGYSMIVQRLLKCDESAAYIGDRDGTTALHIAASKGHKIIVKYLIDSCPDCCELVDKNGWNFIHFAAKSGNLDVVEDVFEDYSLSYLLNEKDNEGNTPLHLLANHHGPDTRVYSLVSRLIKHHRVDKMVFDNKNLNAFDIISANPTSTLKWKRHIEKKLQEAGVRKFQRNITYKGVGKEGKEDVGKGGKDDEDKGTNLSEIKKATETHIVVAALIATVAFAASFTMPGGYISDKGPDQGTPVLVRRAAFRAFVISNSIAMMLSSSAVFIYIFLAMPLPADKYKFPSYFKLAAYLNIFAAGAMMVAFMTGQYAVLQHSSGLAIATCVIGSSFFFFYYELFLRSYVGPLLKSGGEASFLDLLDKALDAFNDLLETAIHTFADPLEKAMAIFVAIPVPIRVVVIILVVVAIILAVVAITSFLVLFSGLVLLFWGLVFATYGFWYPYNALVRKIKTWWLSNC